MLIMAKIKVPHTARNKFTNVFYLWEEDQGAATLVHTERECPMFRPLGAPHAMAHCDGLVMVPAEKEVRLLNPATGHFQTLPWSRATDASRGQLPGKLRGHQSFGFGRDLRSDKYKVVRFFYRSLQTPYDLAMEVCTLGMDRLQWRETAVPPPYPIMPVRTATFFKGSLMWTIESSLLGATAAVAAPGFVRFSLEDESFSITPLPPCSPRPFDYSASSLAELRGELCVAHPTCNHDSLKMWMCSNLDGNPPLWDLRYTVSGMYMYHGRWLRPIAMFEDEIVFQDGHCRLFRYDCRSREGEVKDRVWMQYLRYRNPSENNDGAKLVRYTREAGYDFNAIPYVPSLVTDSLMIIRWK
jgi:F-box interacting protein